MRQSQDIAIANQYQARFDSFLSIQLGLLENVHTLRFTGGIARSRYREIASVDQLTLLETMDDEELGATYLYAFMTLKQFDNLYFQYQAGFWATRAGNLFRRHVEHFWPEARKLSTRSRDMSYVRSFSNSLTK